MAVALGAVRLDRGNGTRRAVKVAVNRPVFGVQQPERAEVAPARGTKSVTPPSGDGGYRPSHRRADRDAADFFHGSEPLANLRYAVIPQESHAAR